MSQEIRDAYNVAASEYRKKYDAISARITDVDLVLRFVHKENPSVLEIGCAYGREAKYIITKTNQYVGIDIADEYIQMAKTEIPEGDFVRADIMEYNFPSNVDIIFAFASLLHIPKEQLQVLFISMHKALSNDGLIFLSLKRKNEYSSEVETDDLVSRRFFYYNRETIVELAGTLFREVYYAEQGRDVPWFTMILQKQTPVQ